MRLTLLSLFSILWFSLSVEAQQPTRQNQAPAAASNNINTGTQAENDKAKIENYLKNKKLSGFKPHESGLYYRIDQEGTGEQPTTNDEVTCHYKGTLLDGTQFDASYTRNEPLSFKLSQVIKGWQIGIPMLKKGGKATFIIPSLLAYGSQAMGVITPNSVLVFEVELLDFVRPGERKQRDIAQIKAYLEANKIKDAQNTANGVYYVIDKQGEGGQPTINDEVTCHYKGTLLDGSEFDSSYGRGTPATFKLTQVIKGWQEGIPMLKKGGKARLFIPSELAYGSSSRPKIPANSVLVFEVELLDFKKPVNQTEKDIVIIKEYIATQKNQAFKTTPGGVFYRIDQEGQGPSPTIKDIVKCHYKGALLDGKEFDSSYLRGEPSEFPLAGVIRGWQEGIPMLKKGGKATLIIPSELAYGQRGAGGIPANSVLLFEVELLDIMTPSSNK